jgi:rare lipoprotein A
MATKWCLHWFLRNQRMAHQYRSPPQGRIRWVGHIWICAVGRRKRRKMMLIRFILTISVLLAYTWFGGIALAAASARDACRGGTMNATQYSSSSGTASGERFRPDGPTAAHRKLPFGTRVKVMNLRTGATTIVRINDRGPFTRGRDIDLSRGAARAIGLTSVGTVCTEIL